jgi:hypothetical protein
LSSALNSSSLFLRPSAGGGPSNSRYTRAGSCVRLLLAPAPPVKGSQKPPVMEMGAAAASAAAGGLLTGAGASRGPPPVKGSQKPPVMGRSLGAC